MYPRSAFGFLGLSNFFQFDSSCNSSKFLVGSFFKKVFCSSRKGFSFNSLLLRKSIVFLFAFNNIRNKYLSPLGY